jgi:two-component system, cell cycle sensor histidine kinase and response regulator CckA
MAEPLITPGDLSTVLEAMREGLQIVDRSWRYVFLNDAAAEHGKRPKEQLLGRTMMESYPGIAETEMFRSLRRAMEERESSSVQNEFKYPDGSARVFELRIAPCEVGIMILSIDVTEGRKLEEQFRQAQKMEAVGRLAGGVAHDFNNLLSVIIGHSTLLLEELKPIDPLVEDLKAIKAAGERGSALTQQLLSFSRQQVLAPRVLDLNQLVADSERMLRRLVGEDVELVTSLARKLARVKADPGQMDQVLMNLVVNARDAMPDGGKITIETEDVLLDSSYTTAHFGIEPGPYVMLAVSDTGLGMDRQTQARIFEPFFTTKEPGKGTGLGLSTVFGIVKQNSGTIWVYSEVGNGTTFKLYFPRADGMDVSVVESVQSAQLEGTETILLVEDQDEVRNVARAVLRRYGYNVLEACNAGEALLTCERHPRAISLLLTDVVMPQMSGRELAERLLRVRPDLKVLYMSGYTDNAVIHHGMLDSGVAYLQKPLVPEALARRVRSVLDAVPRKVPS